MAAFADTCRARGLPAVIERSRSGRGGHVWFFVEDAIPAALARKLGSFLLTETMERRPDIGLDSYDRLFPNQDTLPQGGFGNLIAMPRQKQARERGSSVFVDNRFEPQGDQSALRNMSAQTDRGQVLVRGVQKKALSRGYAEESAATPVRPSNRRHLDAGSR